jgi:hypothetical protein
MSISGVYIHTEVCPELGARIQVDVMLPRLKNGNAGMHLYGEGSVLRVEPKGHTSTKPARPGFAASVQFFPQPSELALLRVNRPC